MDSPLEPTTASNDPNVSTEEEEEDDDIDDEADDSEEERGTPTSQVRSRKPRSFLTGRGVTLAMLMEDGIMQPGEKLLSIDYLGQKFQADLLPDGKIKWPEANKVFNSPSAWAIYCKKLVNPSKKSGCGWASVKYKGRKLDQYKSTWFRKQRAQTSDGDASLTSPKSTSEQMSPSTSLTSPTRATAAASVPTSAEKASSSVKLAPALGPRPVGRPRLNPLPRGPSRPVGRPRLKSPAPGIRKISSPSMTASLGFPSPSPVASGQMSPTGTPLLRLPSPHIKSPLATELPVPLTSPTTPSSKKRSVRTRLSVKHSTVKPDSDPHTLVELVNFTTTGRMQPFSIDISTNCLLLMDYHCHLTTSEVTGYLAGRWDPQTHHMKILQAFPCRCRFQDKENAPKVEDELHQAIGKRGMHLVGWYHSHPSYQADPSVQDIKSQLRYQHALQQGLSGPQEPCLGLIISPYDTYKPTKESTFRAFWVQRTQEGTPDSLGIPMHMNFNVQQDQFLSQDLLNELRWTWSFYKGSPDIINFNNMWYSNQTFLDKVKASLIKKFPTDQADGRFLEFINTLLG
ncbi:MPN domain-containing protein [Nematostella vectensis]|uniref:MPN domain-containing protein n=1 Tax=Nematostella vectensis TaxID=45351 RepID=UPI00138FEF8B|nr:MPN domain-containing protein [Nematostella vectensis]